MDSIEQRLKQYAEGIQQLIDSQRIDFKNQGTRRGYIEAPISSAEKISLLGQVLSDFYRAFPELNNEARDQNDR